MLDRLKTYLGVEGVRLEVKLADPVRRSDGIVSGVVTLSTLRSQCVDSLSLRLTERYARGRGDHKRIDEYLLGESEVDCSIPVAPGEFVDVPFSLSFAERRTPLERQVDRLGPLASPVARLARLSYAATSTYELTAAASISGVALQPVCSVALEFE